MPTLATDQVSARLRQYLKTRAGGIVAAYLFGSVARGTARPGSDVDVGVLLRDPPPPGLAGLLLDLEADLEKLLECAVQVVVLNHAPVDLIHRVLRDSVLLLESDHARRVAFEVRARAEYFDLLPILLRYRRLA